VVLEFLVPKPVQDARSGSPGIRETIATLTMMKFDILLETLHLELEAALGPATRGSGVAVGSEKKYGYSEFRPYEYHQSKTDR